MKIKICYHKLYMKIDIKFLSGIRVSKPRLLKLIECMRKIFYILDMQVL